MPLIVQLTGWLLVALAALHISFPRHFEWKKDLAPLTLINRQMMEVHTFFIALIVLLMGVLCITSADELIHTDLGKTISCGLAIFWGARLVTQFVWYSPILWKGKTFETFAHIGLSALWIGLTILFGSLALN